MLCATGCEAQRQYGVAAWTMNPNKKLCSKKGPDEDGCVWIYGLGDPWAQNLGPRKKVGRSCLSGSHLSMLTNNRAENAQAPAGL